MRIASLRSSGFDSGYVAILLQDRPFSILRIAMRIADRARPASIPVLAAIFLATLRTILPRFFMVLGKSDLVELQVTHPSNAEITEKFFEMDESPKNGIHVQASAHAGGSGHQAQDNSKRQQAFFRFLLSIFLRDNTSAVDFLNAYNKVRETRELIGMRAVNPI